MDKKRVSLLEDHSPPFRLGRLSGTGGGGSLSSSSSSTQFHSRNTSFDQGSGQQSVESCVSKETSQEDCARQRFIVWAAVKRNESLRRHPEKKLECPLLKCNKQFENHELMLRHLSGCTLLTAGEYWCYDHMRVERFDDIKCKRCLGHPSKRRKIVTVAKKIFHSLGHKSKKVQAYDLEDDEQMMMMPPPPSYESIGPLPPSNATELPLTEILEADSVEVPVVQPAVQEHPVLSASDGAVDPQDLLISEFASSLPELDSTMMIWQQDSIIEPYLPLQFEDDISMNSAYRPMLQLATNDLQQRRPASRPTPRPAPAMPRNSKGLSPSSSVRSTASTESNSSTSSTDSAMTNASTISHGSTSSNGSSLVSPISNWSGAWSSVDGTDRDTSMASPMEGLMMVDDNFCDSMINYNDSCAGPRHDFIAELSGDFPVHKATDDLAALSLPEFETPHSVNITYAPAINLTEDPVELLAIEEAEDEQVDLCCSETQTLVSTAWDTLQEHIVSSMVKIRDIQGNPLASHLRSMSIRTIAATGLTALRSLLDAKPPTTSSAALCLVHLVYALSLVVYEQEASHRLKDFYLQSLSYMHYLPPNDRDHYRELAILIWQPPDLEGSNAYSFTLARESSSADHKGKSPEIPGSYSASGANHVDSLLSAARDFLDELEISLVMGLDFASPNLQASVLCAKHHQDGNTSGVANKALSKTVESILETISLRFNTHENQLHPRLNDIFSSVNYGTISSVRRIEIELLSAGRECLLGKDFYAIYNTAIRELCDRIYEQHDTGPSRRNAYHEAGISLIESLIPVVDNTSYSQAQAAKAIADDLDKFLEFGTLETPLPTFDLDINALAGLESTPAMTTPNATSSSSGTTTPASETKPIDLDDIWNAVSAPSETGQPAKAATFEEEQAQTEKVSEADSYCDECGYRPKGAPQWFKGSMAKHKKTKHSKTPPRIYKCPFPGCTSQYRNRPDNLRQHQLEKNHFVQGEDVTPRRPSKRKKTAAEE